MDEDFDDDEIEDPTQLSGGGGGGKEELQETLLRPRRSSVNTTDDGPNGRGYRRLGEGEAHGRSETCRRKCRTPTCCLFFAVCAGSLAVSSLGMVRFSTEI